jgi:hypothetical protein
MPEAGANQSDVVILTPLCDTYTHRLLGTHKTMDDLNSIPNQFTYLQINRLGSQHTIYGGLEPDAQRLLHASIRREKNTTTRDTFTFG